MKNPFHRKPDVVIGDPARPYLLRWHLITRNPLLNVYLHNMLRDDDDRAMHDHPWVSVSLTLKGQYIEHIQGKFPRYRKCGDIVFRRAKHTHRIALHPIYPHAPYIREIPRIPAWTLFITGPKIRGWGFHCPQGWIPWEKFTDPKNPGATGKGCDQ